MPSTGAQKALDSCAAATHAALDNSVAVLHSRSQFVPVSASDLGFGPGEPVDLDAVVLLVPNRAAVWDGLDVLLSGAVPFDAVPDDGVEGGGIGPVRLRFGPQQQLHRFEPSSISVPPNGGRLAEVTWRATAPMQMEDAFVVAYPANAVGDADLQPIDVWLGTGRPTGTHPKYLSAVFRGSR